jgi:hypothetical protein
MKRSICVIICIMLMILTVPSSQAGDLKFPVGPSFISGYLKVTSLYEDYLGGVFDSWTLPIGASFHPYYQFDFGMRLGFGVGPFSLIIGDATYYNVPVSFQAGFSFIPRANFSPYIKTGAIYNIAGGDYVAKSHPGFLVGLGFEFNRKRLIGFGFEIAYETAALTLEDDEFDVQWDPDLGTTYTVNSEKVRPNGLIISFFIIF